MSSAAGPSVLFTSNSSLESIEEYIEEEEEYVPLLTSRQHFVNNLESDIEEEEEEDTDTRSVRKNKRKPKTVQLPQPPNFEHFIHSKLLHQAFINLPPNYDANFSKPINIFLLFFTNSILDTIVINTNLYALTKNAGTIGRKWQEINRKELLI